MLKMNIQITIACLIGLASCKSSDQPTSRFTESDPIRVSIQQAFSSLKERAKEDSYFIVSDSTDSSQYLQFYTHDGELFFDRPILSESIIDSPSNSPLMYHNVEQRPKLINPSIKVFLSEEARGKAKKCIDLYGIEMMTIYSVTRDEQGKDLEFFEEYRGRLDIDSALLDDFVIDFITTVYDSNPESLKLKITEN